MATAFVTNFLWFVYVLIPTPSYNDADDIGNGNVSSGLITIAWVLLYLVFWLPSITLFHLTLLPVIAFSPYVTAFNWFLRKVHCLIVVNCGAAVSRVPTLESGKDGRSGFEPGMEEVVSDMIKQVYLTNSRVESRNLGGWNKQRSLHRK